MTSENVVRVIYAPPSAEEEEGWRIVADLDELPRDVAEKAGMSPYRPADDPTASGKRDLWATPIYPISGSREQAEWEAKALNDVLNDLLRSARRCGGCGEETASNDRRSDPVSGQRFHLECWETEAAEARQFAAEVRRMGDSGPAVE